MVLFLFLLGLCVGSFLNVVIERLPRGEGIVRGRSHCPHCGHELAGRDLVPLLSFIALRGRCRYCGEKISWQYPLVELATGVIFSLSTIQQFNNSTISVILYSLFLIPIFAIDLKHGIIPDKLIYPAVALIGGFRVIGVIGGIWGMWENLKNDASGLGQYLLQTEFFRHHAWLELRPFLFTLVGSFILYSFFFILHSATSGRGIGGGDVKLVFLVGLVTGFPGMIVAVFSAFLTGALASIILILLHKKKFGETVPFGPFLVVGTYIALFWGSGIINWYLRLLQ